MQPSYVTSKLTLKNHMFTLHIAYNAMHSKRVDCCLPTIEY